MPAQPGKDGPVHSLGRGNPLLRRHSCAAGVGKGKVVEGQSDGTSLTSSTDGDVSHSEEHQQRGKPHSHNIVQQLCPATIPDKKNLFGDLWQDSAFDLATRSGS
jgi:hypothetical protein